jgi:hypothetical protein
MLVKSPVCPGPHWREVPVAFVLCEISGARIVPSATDRFWCYDPAC